VTEQETAQGSAPRPIPDLGYFAGPAKPRGSSSFGGVPAQHPSGSPAPSRFTTPSVNQFGNAPTAPFGTVPPPAYAGVSPDHRPRSRPGFSGLRARGIIGTVVVLVVLGFFGVGRMSGLFLFLQGDLSAPTTLSGVPRVTGPAAEAAEREGRQVMSNQGTHHPLVAIYNSGPTTLILAAARGHADIDAELRDVGVTSGQTTKIGDNTCAVTAKIAICMRSSRTLSVFVGSGPQAMEQLSAAVDEAWDKL
jgi:hypothetical protein